MVDLQGIIGTTKDNPNISVGRDAKNGKLHVYHGLSLFEIVPDKKDSVQRKFLAARLYNGGVKPSIITQQLGYCYRSIVKWARVVANGNIEEMVQALEGQGAPRKLTPIIEGFVSFEFNRIYPHNKATYSKEVRASIYEVFNVKLAPETLRPLFKRLREGYQQAKAKEIKAKEERANVSFRILPAPLNWHFLSTKNRYVCHPMKVLMQGKIMPFRAKIE